MNDEMQTKDFNDWHEIALDNALTVESLAHMLHVCAHESHFPHNKIVYVIDALFELCDPLVDSVEKCVEAGKTPE